MCVLRSFILCQQKKTARPRKLRHFVPSRWLHPLAPLMRLSPVDLPSANSMKCCSPPASFINYINIYQSNGEQERVIYMKKMFILVMAVMLCFTLTACNEEENIDFSFELSSIENVEMFRFTNPADAEKKVITKSEDIEEIYQTFESVSLKDKTTEPTAGGSVTSFRFNLSDGTSYEVIYSEVAVKAGRVITTGMEQDFFTSADIGAFWVSYDYEVTTASEDELPALYE